MWALSIQAPDNLLAGADVKMCWDMSFGRFPCDVILQYPDFPNSASRLGEVNIVLISLEKHRRDYHWCESHSEIIAGKSGQFMKEWSVTKINWDSRHFYDGRQWRLLIRRAYIPTVHTHGRPMVIAIHELIANSRHTLSGVHQSIASSRSSMENLHLQIHW